MSQYKITWEMVSAVKHPELYYNEGPNTPNFYVPEECWHTVEKETDNPWDQYNTLRKWAEEGTEYIRNVHLYELVSSPEWRER